jgi:hypothetical protein
MPDGRHPTKSPLIELAGFFVAAAEQREAAFGGEAVVNPADTVCLIHREF